MYRRPLQRVRALLRPSPESLNAKKVAQYFREGRRPWSVGYREHKQAFIEQRLGDVEFLKTVRATGSLPKNYGEFMDERVVEYPWLYSRLPQRSARLLDAGSVLNQSYLVQHPLMKMRDLTLLTLAPEGNCFWQQKISYVFGDIRELPFRDEYFDEVVCLSTLEHIGKNNTQLYTADARFNENNSADFEKAARELKRVSKKGGKIFLTVPFGCVQDGGWFQQFDATMLDRLISLLQPASLVETYYQYKDGGWSLSTREACKDCRSFDIHTTKHMNPASQTSYDPDFAAASRAIAALEMGT